jgi:hypothetical protein
MFGRGFVFLLISLSADRPTFSRCVFALSLFLCIYLKRFPVTCFIPAVKHFVIIIITTTTIIIIIIIMSVPIFLVRRPFWLLKFAFVSFEVGSFLPIMTA